MDKSESKKYICIDLKSFYASVECAELGLDPFTTNLVVADVERTKGTVCLAITPAMKKLGVKNRCRLFEIPKNIEYITVKPKMSLYMKKSAEIYSVYLKYVAPEDIHVYSVDECFIDITDYIKLYDMSAVEIAKMLIKDVYQSTKIPASVGIGDNLFLAKVALDITAKHSEDSIGILDVDSFKKSIWFYKPITDIWSIGDGIAKRLKKYGVTDLYGVAHMDEKILYREFGVNAELLIDHANGVEPCTIKDIKAYVSKNSSISHSQILPCDYSVEDASVILKEMVEKIVLELIEKRLVTNNISLLINYSKTVNESGTGGSRKLAVYTNSIKKLMKIFVDFYMQTVNKNLPIRKISIGLNNVVDEKYKDFDLLSNIEEENREKTLQNTIIDIKRKFGKNSILRGMSYQKNATARERNKMIGGHNGGEDDKR